MNCLAVFARMLLVIMIVFLGGCSATLDDYKNTQPNFDMKTFFDGQLKAYGIVQNRSGKVLRRFTVDLDGRWQGDKGTLEEDFVYDDGEKQRRVWLLEKMPDGSYSGTADDVIGGAVGSAQGFAFSWQYTLLINVDGEDWAINLDDWIYQIDETRLINKTEMTKWGFNVGEVILVIEKIDK